MPDPQRLEAIEFDSAELVAAHPPVWEHDLKQKIYEQIGAQGGPLSGKVSYSRWQLSGLPSAIPAGIPKVEVDADFYTYPVTPDAEWHVNFADPDLFVAYSSYLLAQDKLQVLEHPLLGSVREALLASGQNPSTREEEGSTPILIANVPRQCALDTFPDPDQGRPRGLYGNRFQEAGWPEVQSALTILRPPTMTNFICMAAPTGWGRYTAAQIRDALETAFTGLRAAVLESARLEPGRAVVVHTGFWGCGAFGGNRSLMSLLQVLAARLAGIDKLVFHTGTQSEVIPFENGRSILQRILGKLGADASLADILAAIDDQHFQWGVSDGN